MSKLIALLPILFMFSCIEKKEAYYCADNGFRYITLGSNLAPDFNKLGLPKRCEKLDK